MAEFRASRRATGDAGRLVAGFARVAALLGLLLTSPSLAQDSPDAPTGRLLPPDAGSFGLIEALTLMLESDPNVALSQTGVLSAQGALDVQRGSFDPFLGGTVGALDSEEPLSETTVQSIEGQSLGVTYDQLFRTGLSLIGDLDITRTEGSPQATNVGTVTFTLRQPLARGRGRVATAANERSAELGLLASQLDLRHRVAERILAVAAQYWSVVSALGDLAILRENELRARISFENYQRLVEADQVPAADLVQLEADVMSRRVARLTAEQTLFDRRQTLGFEIGLDAQASAALPLPSDDFPSLDEPVPDPLDPRWLRGAVVLRADRLALGTRLQSAEVLLEAAENALLPRVDLVLTPSYVGLTEDDELGGFFGSLADNVPGVSTSFGLSVGWPLRNRAAEGRLLQSEASLRSRELQIELLENSITSEVSTAIDAVRATSEQLAMALRAVDLFEQALENEQKKLRASRSTTLDTITQRDRLTSAQQRQNAAEFALALALLRLRFQTGTLLEPDDQAFVLDFERLTTLPEMIPTERISTERSSTETAPPGAARR